MKTLWVVSGGAEAVPGLMRAKEMGLHVVVSDASADAPGLSVADEFVQASTYDIEASVAAAKYYHQTVRPLDGVICLAADVPLTVASIAAELGLPGISVETAQLAMDKLAMKDRFAAHGVPIPWYCAVDSAEELRRIVNFKKLPLILKPVDSRGARGVLQLTETMGLDWAFDHARSNSPTGRVMVEEYLCGPQISTESVILEGKGYTPGFCDRNYELLECFSPYIIENGGQQPSVLTPDQQNAVRRCAEQAGLSLGVITGIVKGDMVWTEVGPKVIEVAARLSGGWFSSDQIPLATGVDIVAAAIKLALGEKVTPKDLTLKHQKGVAIRYFFPNPGRVLSIDGASSVALRPGVYKIDFFVEPGDLLEPTINHTKRCGYVITSGVDRDEAVQRAQEVISSVRVETRSI